MAGNAIGKIRVDLVANTRQFATGMRNATGSVKRFRGVAAAAHAAFAAIKVASLGAAAALVAAGYALTRHVMEQMKVHDEIGKTADRLGVGAKALQAFQHAASLAGVETNVFNKALQMMIKNIGEAATGTGEARDVFERLGLDPKKLRAMGPEQALYQIADAMQHVETQTERLEMAFALFGGRGTGVLNMLAGGSRGLKDIAGEFDFIDREQIRNMEIFNDSVTRLSKSWDLFGATLGANVAPFLTIVAREIRSLTKDISELGSGLAAVSRALAASSPWLRNLMELAELAFVEERRKMKPTLPEIPPDMDANKKTSGPFFGAPEAVQQGTVAAYSAERVARIQTNARGTQQRREEQWRRDMLREAEEQNRMLRNIERNANQEPAVVLDLT